MTEILYTHTRENPDLIGHEKAEAELLESVIGGKVPHSWLITGPRGIGKANLAYRFARFLLAENFPAPVEKLPTEDQELFAELLPSSGHQPPTTNHQLNLPKEHNIFRRVAQGSHPDLMVIELGDESEKKEITVDEIRKIEHFLRLTPSESKWRIVIIDSADEMNRNAANAMLKILEEPPSDTIMLLISHVPGRLLPTIRSRCRFLRINPLSDESVMRVLNKLQPDLIAREARFASSLSEGSPGFALNLYSNNGLKLYHEIVDILRTLPHIDITLLDNFSGKFGKKDANSQWRIATYMLGYFLAETANYAVTHEHMEEFIEGEQQVREFILSHYPVDHIVNIWERISQVIAEADGLNMDRKMTLYKMFGLLRRAA